MALFQAHLISCVLYDVICVSTSKKSLIVSLIILALGVPCTPKLTTSAVALQRPAGLIPVHASADLSKVSTWSSETAEAWCPQVAALYADPVNHFLAFLEIRAILEILVMRILDLVRRWENSLLGLRLPAQNVMPRSLAWSGVSKCMP